MHYSHSHSQSHIMLPRNNNHLYQCLCPHSNCRSNSLSTMLQRQSILASRRARKCGKGDGIRYYLRRATKLPLPSLLLRYPRSLKNKLDKLCTHVGACYEYRESCLLVFMQTWLHNDVPDNFIQISGFPHMCSNRDENSGKTKDNKSYITKGIKECINRMKIAYRWRDTARLKAAQKHLNQ